MAELPGPWPARIAWAALPITVGSVLGAALEDRSRSVVVAGSALAWLVWAGGLLAVAIPRTASLTALRVLGPLVLPVVLWAALQGDGGVGGVVAVGWAALLLLSVLWPEVAEAFADGSSYGDERRMLLRTPTPLLLGPVPLAWAVAVTGPVAGVLLLAAERWALGAAVLVIGGAASLVAVRALHGLARRWVVFVPAGIVLHDLQAMGDPFLFPRSSVAALGPARDADDRAVLDLTLGTVGLVLQLDLREPVEVSPRRGRRHLALATATHLRFAPARPGALLAEARRRRIG